MTDNKVTSNGILDILLNGLMKTNSLNISALGTLSQVTKLFQVRLKKDFIWQQLPAEEANEEPTAGYITARDQHNINNFVRDIPTEFPCAQPRDSEGWAQIDAVPREIKSLLIALHAKIGPDLMTYVRGLYIPYVDINGSNAEDILNWLQALQALYNSANDNPDLFHGLFLSNHNFARRAYYLARKSSLDFSVAVLEVCAECRFSSLTMNSKQLDDFFTQLAGLYAAKKAAYPKNHPLPFQVTHADIKAHIIETSYPKALLVAWNATKSKPISQEKEASLSIESSNDIKATPSPS